MWFYVEFFDSIKTDRVTHTFGPYLRLRMWGDEMEGDSGRGYFESIAKWDGDWLIPDGPEPTDVDRCEVMAIRGSS